MQHRFKAEIYKTGINWAVDVPMSISKYFTAIKGYIPIKGHINKFEFTQTLVPVKNGLYRLFVNHLMMIGGGTALGKVAEFIIEQNDTKPEHMYPMPKIFADTLNNHQLSDNFNQLTPSRRKDILKYLSFIKTEETMKKNIDKVIMQLKNKIINTRIP